MTKNILIATATILALGLTACGNNDAKTVEKMETTSVEVKTAAEIQAEKVAAELKAEGSEIVGAAEQQAERLNAAGDRIVEATEANAERLKAEGRIMTDEAKQQMESAKAIANDYKETATEPFS